MQRLSRAHQLAVRHQGAPVVWRCGKIEVSSVGNDDSLTVGCDNANQLTVEYVAFRGTVHVPSASVVHLPTMASAPWPWLAKSQTADPSTGVAAAAVLVTQAVASTSLITKAADKLLMVTILISVENCNSKQCANRIRPAGYDEVPGAAVRIHLVGHFTHSAPYNTNERKPSLDS
eukprot:365546-Chlamydomonas_euryale.AAC.2